jgi:hypothetical protein
MVSIVIAVLLAVICVILFSKYLYQTYLASSTDSSRARLGEYQLSDTSSHHGTSDSFLHSSATSSSAHGNDQEQGSRSGDHGEKKKSRFRKQQRTNTGDEDGLDDEYRIPTSLRGKAGEAILSMLPRRVLGRNKGSASTQDGSGKGYEMVPTSTTRNPFTIQHQESDEDEEEEVQLGGYRRTGGQDREGGYDGEDGEDAEDEERGSRRKMDDSKYSPYYFLKKKEEDLIVKANLQKNIVQSATSSN